MSNRRGQATGTGSVNVQAGALAGKGIISGAVTIGTGSGSGAFLAPAAGSQLQAILTIQSALTFNADATYAYTFKAKRNRASTDRVFANGVTINSGAMIALSGQTQGRLTTGLTLTLISNTSANPISGTFNNLPDGGDRNDQRQQLPSQLLKAATATISLSQLCRSCKFAFMARQATRRRLYCMPPKATLCLTRRRMICTMR